MFPLFHTLWNILCDFVSQACVFVWGLMEGFTWDWTLEWYKMTLFSLHTLRIWILSYLFPDKRNGWCLNHENFVCVNWLVETQFIGIIRILWIVFTESNEILKTRKFLWNLLAYSQMPKIFLNIYWPRILDISWWDFSAPEQLNCVVIKKCVHVYIHAPLFWWIWIWANSYYFCLGVT